MLITKSLVNGRSLSSIYAHNGFTLIELIIVMGLIGILSFLAIPQYQNYSKRTRFTEVISQISAIKRAVDICYQTKSERNLTLCDSEQELGISFSSIQQNVNIDSIQISAATAAITVTTNANLDSKTYILVPNETEGSLVWSQSGTCLEVNFCS